MSTFNGVLPYGRGTIDVSRVETTQAGLKSYQFVDKVPVNDNGQYSFTVKHAGRYRFTARLLAAQYPAFEANVAAGTGAATLMFPTPINRSGVLKDGSQPGDGKSSAERMADLLGTPTNGPMTAQRDVSGQGIQPEWVDDVLTYGAGGNGSYRSEYIWGTGPATTDQVRLTHGMYLAAEWDQYLDEGFSNQDANSWNVIAQVHGPSINGTWNPPPVEINFQNGTFRVSNSTNVPLQDGTTVAQFDEYLPRIRLDRPIGEWHHFKIGVRLGGPGVGTVDLWIDGKHVVVNWQPKAGTFYTHANVAGASQGAHNYVIFKTGLYGHQTSGTPKALYQRNMRITTHQLNSITTLRK